MNLSTNCMDCGAILHGGATIHSRTCRFWSMSYQAAVEKISLRNFCNLHAQQIFVRTDKGTKAFGELTYVEREHWIDEWHKRGSYSMEPGEPGTPEPEPEPEPGGAPQE